MKKLLITGGTGSFGNAMVKHILKQGNSDIQEIRILSRDEKKQEDMRNTYADPRIMYYIGDVRDPSTLQKAMSGVNWVFHAAAMKQVPSCEEFPIEALKTNVQGTANVLGMARQNHVDKVVLLSTDKAVMPVNTMGMTKALAEKLALFVAKEYDTGAHLTEVCVTRYGNVMGSRGSVIPKFIEQFKSGKPLTITDATMTRFMMSLEEAVDLVEYALRCGHNGHTYVLKAPATSVLNIATAVAPEAAIVTVGARPGEKLHETLVTSAERTRSIERIGEVIDIFPEWETSSTIPGSSVEYRSDNTRQLSLAETCVLLRTAGLV